MRPSSRVLKPWHRLDAPRIVAGTVVVVGHLALLLVLAAAMRTPDFSLDPAIPGETALTLDFLPTVFSAPATLPKLEAKPPTAGERGALDPPKETVSSTSAVFLDEPNPVSEAQRNYAPTLGADDVFDPPAAHKPFPTSPRILSNLPSSVIRVPGRPSVMQSYWAVPEGENLQGRYAREIPLLGFVLFATGAIGAPFCPPKSEHPDCLQRLIDGRSP